MKMKQFRSEVTKANSYWVVSAFRIGAVNSVGPYEIVDFCVPSELPKARRRVLRRARKMFQ